MASFKICHSIVSGTGNFKIVFGNFTLKLPKSEVEDLEKWSVQRAQMAVKKHSEQSSKHQIHYQKYLLN